MFQCLAIAPTLKRIVCYKHRLLSIEGGREAPTIFGRYSTFTLLVLHASPKGHGRVAYVWADGD